MPSSLALQGAIKLRRVMELYLPRAMAARELLKLFPLTKVNEVDLVYERRGVATGVQHARGLGGPSGPVKKPGLDSYRISPGYYGDFYPIEEADLLRLRDVGDWNNFESYSAQTARATQHLTTRFLDRCELSVGQLLTTGGFTAQNAQGVVYHQDVFDIKQYTPATLFSDLAASTPMKYIRDIIPTLELGKAISYRKGWILASRPTINLVLNNANAADVLGRRVEGGNTVNGLDAFNDILLANDLPRFRPIDDGYYNDAGAFVRFIPNGKLVLVGAREDGEQLGEYRLTRAVQNGDNSGPGEWYTVKDYRDQTPPRVVMEAGHNGGPWVAYPEGVTVLNVAAPF